jgi:hypothetical protein
VVRAVGAAHSHGGKAHAVDAATGPLPRAPLQLEEKPLTLAGAYETTSVGVASGSDANEALAAGLASSDRGNGSHSRDRAVLVSVMLHPGRRPDCKQALMPQSTGVRSVRELVSMAPNLCGAVQLSDCAHRCHARRKPDPHAYAHARVRY